MPFHSQNILSENNIKIFSWQFFLKRRFVNKPRMEADVANQLYSTKHDYLIIFMEIQMKAPKICNL